MSAWRAIVRRLALVALLAPLCLSSSPGALPADEIRALTDAGKDAEAAEAASALLEVVEAVHGPNTVETAEALELLARALALEHAYDPKGKEERLKLAERALGIRRKLHEPGDIALAWSHYVVGLVHNLTWEPRLSIGLFKTALDIAEEYYGKDHPETEIYVREYGTAVFGVGHHVDALEVFERYRNIAVAKHGDGSPATLKAYFNLALTHRVLGRIEEADGHLRTAEAILEAQDPVDDSNLVWVRSFRGTMLALQGQLADSLRMFERTLVLARHRLGPYAPEVAELENLLARNLIDLGDYERARDLLSKTLDGLPSESVGIMSCSMRFNLATAYQRLGEVEAAAEAFETFARDAPPYMDPSDPIWGEFHGEYAAHLFERGDDEGARTQLDRALELHRELGVDTIDFAETLAESGSLYLEMGDAAKARAQLERAIEIIDDVASGHQRFYAANEKLAEALYASSQTGSAFEASLEAAHSSSQFDRATIASLPRSLALARATRPHLVRDIVTTLVVTSAEVPAAWKRDAFTLLARSRAITLDEMAARQRRWADSANPEILERIDAWNAARTRVANLFVMGSRGDVGQYVERLESAQRTVERLEQDLAASSVEHRAAFQRRDAEFDEFRATLGRGEALLSYVRYGRRTPGASERVSHYAAAVLRPADESPVWIDLGPAVRVEEAILDWRSALTPVSVKQGGEQAYRAAADALKKILWDPLASSLSGTETLFVVPDAAIHLVSLSALPVGENAYLIETGPAIHHLTAERDMIRSDNAGSLSAGLLVVGNPAFNADRTSPSSDVYRGTTPQCTSFRSHPFPPLPGAQQEAKVVRDLWSKNVDERVTELNGVSATEGAVKRSMTEHRVVHLATHGFFLGEECALDGRGYRGIGHMSPRHDTPQTGQPRVANPLLLSGLVLAGANRSQGRENVNGEDGILTAEEVATLDMRGVELAVLSACRTGSGSVTEGEGMFGLRRAFLLAGARTVVTNLWDVDDRSAHVWIERLYRERFVEGRSIPESVRAAGRHVLETRRKAGLEPHPFYWAGWHAVGRR